MVKHIILPCVVRFIEADPAHLDSEPSSDSAPPIDGVTRAEVAEAMRMIEARASMRAKIAASDLPDFAKVHLCQRFGGLERFTESHVEIAIAEERDYLYSLYQTVVI
jgi:hypothetical protein